MNRLHKLKPFLLEKKILVAFLFLFAFIFTSCDRNSVVVSQLDEKEANLIVVFLESKGIKADKVKASSGTETGGGQNTGPKFDIIVSDSKTIEAMAVLNRNGLPRKQGTTLLELFGKQGLMTSEKEETIRYQSGLAQQITNTLLLIDGVIDATVQLSFPTGESLPGTEEKKENVTAAVYVKHQGMYDDSSLHLENKVKRIVSGSVTGLDINDVTVVADRSRFTDFTPSEIERDMMKGSSQDYVSVWNIVLNKSSVVKFRFLFFFILFLGIFFALTLGWVIWKLYPTLRAKGFKQLLNLSPFSESREPDEQPPKKD